MIRHGWEEVSPVPLLTRTLMRFPLRRLRSLGFVLTRCRRGVLLPASLVCIGGTTLSGAVFGTWFLFPIIGTMIGFALAFVTSIPISVVILNLARLAHGPFIKKSKIVALGALAGGYQASFRRG